MTKLDHFANIFLGLIWGFRQAHKLLWKQISHRGWTRSVSYKNKHAGKSEVWTLKCEGTAAQSGREGFIQMDSHQASISRQGFWTSTPINVIFWWIGTRSNYSGRQKQLEAVFTTSNKFGGGEKWNSNKSFLNLDSLSTHIRFEVDHFMKTSVNPECGKLELPQWCRCPEIIFSFSLHCQHLMLVITQASADDFGPLRRSVSSLYTWTLNNCVIKIIIPQNVCICKSIFCVAIFKK